LLALSIAATSASAAVKFNRINTDAGGPDPQTVTVRTPDGVLHVLYPTSTQRGGVDGLATLTISPSGKVGAPVQALSGWQAGFPGFVQIAPGQLEAFFGAISPGNESSLWGISSSDGGATWSAPGDVRSASNEALAYGSEITAQMTGSTPVLTVPQAGNLIVQQGLGPTSSTTQLNDTSDGSVGGVETAVDAASGQVIASWQSIAGNPKDFMQAAAPTPGSAQAVPGQSKPTIVIAGRDSGAGVFGAYTTDGKHVRLIRYGGGSVAVGSLKNFPAQALGVATSLDGRVWVMWGNDQVHGGVAVTRSNKAVTRFEPIQHLKPNPGSLYRLSGDGRLGPLDLLVDQIPDVSPIQQAGSFYGRALPVMSAGVSAKPKKNKKGNIVSYSVKVTVTDAGDAVSGATVTIGGKTAKTNSKGVAAFTLPASPKKVSLSVTQPGYNTLKKKVTL
jgi:hypothetical protein